MSARLALILLLVATAASAGDARWIRDPAISPDGRWVAFSYLGDLWVVPAEGGEARAVTTHVAHERAPVWSPDSQWLAFASDRHGNYDVFLVPRAGGPAERLTLHSSDDLPTAFQESGVLFSSARQDDPRASLPTPRMSELYRIALQGGRPEQVLTTPAERAVPSPDGRFLAYQDVKGFENRYRKHHVSSVARDVRIYDRETGRHRKLTDFAGEDRNPVWSPDGQTIYYLSERSGSFNVWSRAADGSGAPAQLTRHGPHPVRSLSITADGKTLAYAYNGELWLCPVGGEPRKPAVTARAGDRVNPSRHEVFRNGATEFAVSPSEEEVAFVVRGEVFVASVEHGTTRRITETPEQERSVAWSPDGKTLYYAGERDGAWNLYRVVRKRAEETHFFHATLLEEQPLLVGPDETFQPVPSPDGKLLAYLHNRDELRVLDLASGASRTVLPAERNYSYADGDIDYAWSPDSQWLACMMAGEGNRVDTIGLVPAAGGEVVNLTLSGYYEAVPRWSADGSAIVFYSNRYGRRSHGSWGSDADVMALDLTRAAHDRASLDEEEFALLKKREEEAEKEKQKGEKKENGKEGPAPPPVRIELEGREDRFRRLTPHSAPMGAFALSPDGERLVYAAEVNGEWALWSTEIRKGDTKRLADLGDGRPGEVYFAKDGKAVFARRSNGGLLRAAADGGKTHNIAYAAEMTVHGPEERAYMFEHCWRQVKRKFYEPTLHGADWDGLKRNYAAFLPHVNNNHDFALLLSEMAGELNASHTGGGYRAPDDDETASLGLLFDPRAAGDALVVAEVLAGGPADRADSKLRAGAAVTHIDGVKLTPALNHHALLNRKAGKPVLLTFVVEGAEPVEEIVKAVPPRDEWRLLHRRWERQRRELTDRLSNGRIGYVHVPGMNERSFRHLYQEALGRHGAKEALLVDTRFNGGGWLHDDLVQFLGAEAYLTHQPRGKERGAMGDEPQNRWTRPVAVLVSEGNYSDAQVFPYAFQRLELGKLVGAPVPGTGTAVWWERQIDPTVVFGIPQIGLVTPDGRYLENLEIQPDVLVYNDPESMASGRDLQLEKGVAVLLEELAGK